MAKTKTKTEPQTTAAPAEVKLNTYEAMFLLGPSGADAEKAVSLVRGMIEKHGGQILVIKKWDERKLAFEINRQKRGTYVISFFKAPAPAIAPLERDVKLSEDVMRILVTRGEHLTEAEMNAVEPQPIAPPPERNPWDRPEGGYGGGGGGDRDRSRGPRGPRRDEAPAGADAKD
jgi:small subunit ribosomal protein S6